MWLQTSIPNTNTALSIITKDLKRRARKDRRAAKSSHPAQLSTKGQPGRRNGRQKWPEIVAEWRGSSAFGRLIAWRVETPRPADRWNTPGKAEGR